MIKPKNTVIIPVLLTYGVIMGVAVGMWLGRELLSGILPTCGAHVDLTHVIACTVLVDTYDLIVGGLALIGVTLYMVILSKALINRRSKNKGNGLDAIPDLEEK